MAELMQSPEKAGRLHRKRVPLKVDLTAMVDLAFLLITFFILTTTLAKPREMSLVMPHGEHPEGIGMSRTMTVLLGSNNKAVAYLGLPGAAKEKLVDFGAQGLRKSLIDAAQQVRANTDKTLFVILKPTSKSAYGNLVEAIDEINITGTPGYAIVDTTADDVATLKKHGLNK